MRCPEQTFCMSESRLVPTSHGKRDPGFAPIRRGLLEHLPEMSSNAVKLYLWLHLKAFWSGPKRGCVETSFEDMARGNGWSYSMARRTTKELTRKGYILVARAANQYQFNTIKILRFDTEQNDSAVSTGEHTKPADNSAVSSAALNGGHSTERSKPGNVQSDQNLYPPKKVKEVKKEKNCYANAVRRPIDAERIASKSFSPKKRRKNLESRLMEKGLKNKSLLDDDFDDEERTAFAATGYTPRDPRKLPNGFVNAVELIWGKYKGTEISQGNLCSKIIDYCQAQQESCVKLGTPAARSDYYWPPDFQDHRDQLRAKERDQEKSQSARVSV